MSARQVLSIAAAILAGGLIGGSLLGQRTAAQVLVPGPQPVGRYQLSAAGGLAACSRYKLGGVRQPDRQGGSQGKTQEV